jgi:hypothetical protein
VRSTVREEGEESNVHFRLNTSMKCFFVVLLIDFIEDTSDAAYGGAGSCVDVHGTAALILEALGEVDIVIDGVPRSRVASKGV